MIGFWISIPFVPKYNKPIFYFTKRVGKHKTFEFQIDYYSRTLLSFDFTLSFRGEDHAGLNLSLTILGLCFHTALVDNRHWDNNNKTWEK